MLYLLRLAKTTNLMSVKFPLWLLNHSGTYKLAQRN
jgi:hypothetical protein